MNNNKICIINKKAKVNKVVIQINNKLPFMDIYMYADRYKLSQVVRNLISNALKFVAKPGGVVIIDIDLVFHHNLKDILPYSAQQSQKKQTQTDMTKQKDMEKINNENSGVTNYIRFSVTDNGAGISKVSILYILIFIYYFIVAV